MLPVASRHRMANCIQWGFAAVIVECVVGVPMKVLTGLFVLMVLLPVDVTAQHPPVGMIDFYGIRSVSPELVRLALRIKEGDTPSTKQLEEARIRLATISGVAEAHLDHICCEQGKDVLHVGIREKGAPHIRYRTSPHGAITLPDEIIRAAREFDGAVREAALAGDAGEDDSQGHALMNNPRGRAIQEKFIVFAARDEALLRKVLHESANAEQRAIAAEVIAYAVDKRKVIGDLVNAVSDPDEGVRNNAARALAVIAVLAVRKPASGITIPAEPFVRMLSSLIWSDRNKSSFALMQLTESRDPKLLERLREEALPSLVEMARWQSHALSASIFLAMEPRRRAAVLLAAVRISLYAFGSTMAIFCSGSSSV